jgi:hypothetical protein
MSLFQKTNGTTPYFSKIGQSIPLFRKIHVEPKKAQMDMASGTQAEKGNGLERHRKK